MPKPPTDPSTAPRLPAVGWRRSLPNALTLLRLVLTAAFLVIVTIEPWTARVDADLIGEQFIVFEHFDHQGILLDAADHSPGLLIAALVFILAAITDALDGYFARRFNAISRFGRVMDPFADKLLILAGFIVLAGPIGLAIDQTGNWFNTSAVQPWMVGLILARELLVTTLRGVYEAEGVDFSATLSGKLKMIAQSVAVPMLLILTALGFTVGGWRYATLAIAWLTVTMTTWSAIPYILRAVRASRATTT